MKNIIKPFPHNLIILQLFFVLLIICLFIQNVYSNGGPVDLSDFYKFDRIKMMNRADVKLQKEVLNITIRDDWSDIHVLYILTNTGTEGDANVQYGFPVDYFNDKCEDCGNWDSVFIKKFSMQADGINLQVKEQKETEKLSGTATDETGNKHETDYNRKWYISEFTIPDNSSVILEVELTLKSAYYDYDIVEDNGYFPKYNPRFIRYDLSPARFWGDASVEDFTVNIDAKSIINNFGTININGIKCNKRDDGIFTFHTKSFEINSTSLITIKYTDDVILNSARIEKDLIPKNRIKVTSSGSLKGNYSTANIIDNKFTTAWVEGKEGDGIGEWIEFEIKDCDIYEIFLLNGYRKSKKTFEENSRPGKIMLSIDYSDEKKNMKNYIDTIDLKEIEYISVPGKKNISKNVNKLSKPDSYFDLTKVRITILEVRKGTKFDDTAISEIFFIGNERK